MCVSCEEMAAMRKWTAELHMPIFFTLNSLSGEVTLSSLGTSEAGAVQRLSMFRKILIKIIEVWKMHFHPNNWIEGWKYLALANYFPTGFYQIICSTTKEL